MDDIPFGLLCDNVNEPPVEVASVPISSNIFILFTLVFPDILASPLISNEYNGFVVPIPTFIFLYISTLPEYNSLTSDCPKTTS